MASFYDIVRSPLISHIASFLSLNELVSFSRCSSTTHAAVPFHCVKAVDLIPAASPPYPKTNVTPQDVTCDTVDVVLSKVLWASQVVYLDLSYCLGTSQPQLERIARLCPNLQELITVSVSNGSFAGFFAEDSKITAFTTNSDPKWTRFPPLLTHFTYDGFQAPVPPGVLNPDCGDDEESPLLALTHLSLWTCVYKTRWDSSFDYDAAGLVALLQRCANLQYLDVSGWEDLYGVAQALREHCPRLHTLIARRSAFTLMDVRQLSARVQTLDVRCCDAITAAEAAQFVQHRDPEAIFEMMEDAMTRISARSDVTEDTYEHEQWVAPSGPFPQWISKLFSAIGKCTFKWQFSDTVGLPYDVQSLGGHINVHLSGVKDSDSWLFAPGYENMCIYAMDHHVAEGCGYLVHNPADDSWYVNWFTSGSLPLWHHKFMTLEEYFVQSARRAFSWYWPVHAENMWILARLHRTPAAQPHLWTACSLCNKWRRRPPGTLESQVEENWMCSMNEDKRRNRCEVPEEPPSSEEEEGSPLDVPLQLGDHVLADWESKGTYYEATVVALTEERKQEERPGGDDNNSASSCCSYTVLYKKDQVRETGVSRERIEFVSRDVEPAEEPPAKKKKGEQEKITSYLNGK